MRVVVALIQGSIRRQYELPTITDSIDREALLRWLLDVIPTREQHQREGPVQLWREDWPDRRE